ncbi:hypothetical protein BBP40_007879 [Aspergillus hancockii]|nr:hypothetical protein BBP40_007879 [Aspergillus hancockii]
MANQDTPTILLLGTCDTKYSELSFTRQSILSQNPNSSVLLMDVGRQPPSPSSQNTTIQIDIPTLTTVPTNENNENNNGSQEPLTHLPRAQYIKTISTHATHVVSNLFRTHKIHGIISIGGSCGTNIATAAMRAALPVGFPKLMVSTMASGDVKPYVEETDITMMYSVVDIAGRNWILEGILGNAGRGISAMALGYFLSLREQARDQFGGRGEGEGKGKKKRVGVTMFGVTTPCVDRLRARLEDEHGCEVYVFHATGAGGKAMERLVREGQLDAVVDLTTSEVVDEVMGGVLSAGPERLSGAAKAGIPQVVSVGACEMANFGPPESVPERYRGRLMYEHNPTVTLVRANADETREIARFIAEKLRRYAARPEVIRLVLPTGGISLIDTPGQPFHDPEVDEVLFSTLEKELEGSGIEILRDSRDINDPEFAVSVADMMGDVVKSL